MSTENENRFLEKFVDTLNTTSKQEMFSGFSPGGKSKQKKQNRQPTFLEGPGSPAVSRKQRQTTSSALQFRPNHQNQLSRHNRTLSKPELSLSPISESNVVRQQLQDVNGNPYVVSYRLPSIDGQRQFQQPQNHTNINQNDDINNEDDQLEKLDENDDASFSRTLQNRFHEKQMSIASGASPRLNRRRTPVNSIESRYADSCITLTGAGSPLVRRNIRLPLNRAVSMLQQRTPGSPITTVDGSLMLAGSRPPLGSTASSPLTPTNPTVLPVVRQQSLRSNGSNECDTITQHQATSLQNVSEQQTSIRASNDSLVLTRPNSEQSHQPVLQYQATVPRRPTLSPLLSQSAPHIHDHQFTSTQPPTSFPMYIPSDYHDLPTAPMYRNYPIMSEETAGLNYDLQNMNLTRQTSLSRPYSVSPAPLSSFNVTVDHILPGFTINQIPDFLLVYAKADLNSDHLIQWSMFQLPQLEFYNDCLMKQYKHQMVQVVIAYEGYRLAIIHELRRRRRVDHARNSCTHATPVYSLGQQSSSMPVLHSGVPANIQHYNHTCDCDCASGCARGHHHHNEHHQRPDHELQRRVSAPYVGLSDSASTSTYGNAYPHNNMIDQLHQHNMNQQQPQLYDHQTTSQLQQPYFDQQHQQYLALEQQPEQSEMPQLHHSENNQQQYFMQNQVAEQQELSELDQTQQLQQPRQYLVQSGPSQQHHDQLQQQQQQNQALVHREYVRMASDDNYQYSPFENILENSTGVEPEDNQVEVKMRPNAGRRLVHQLASLNRCSTDTDSELDRVTVRVLRPDD